MQLALFMKTNFLFFLFAIILIVKTPTKAQFLFTESFVMIPIDTQRLYIGNIVGGFSSQSQKETVNQIAVRAELALRLKKHRVLTIANNMQVITYGNQKLLSGGYLFARFRNDISRSLYPEYFAQAQWLETRGLEQKFALTANIRKRIFRDKTLTLATAAGLLFDYEKWNFNGVKTENTPNNTNSKYTYNPRFNWYFSYDHQINETININAGLYYFLRTSFSSPCPRIGSHIRFSYIINKNLRLNLNLKSMYEYQPIVPVSNLWYIFNNELAFTF